LLVTVMAEKGSSYDFVRGRWKHANLISIYK